MNRYYKRVEVIIEYDYYTETFLIVNMGTYDNPYLTIHYPSMSPHGHLCWYEGKPVIGDETMLGYEIYPNKYDVTDDELQKLINHVYKVLTANIKTIYNSPDTIFRIGDIAFETEGVRNDYHYNQYKEGL